MKSRCKYYLSEYHQAEDCDYAPEPHFINATLHPQGKFSNTHRSLGEPPQVCPPWSSHSQTESQNKFLEICELFNNAKGNMCRFKKCKYMHLCINKGCHGPHPASECTARNPGLGKCPHSPPSQLSSHRS